jgi:hypothetical protein
MLEALTLSQLEGETVAEYAHRAKAACEVFFSTRTASANIYHKKLTPAYDIMDEDEQNVLNNAAMEMMMACVLLKTPNLPMLLLHDERTRRLFHPQVGRASMLPT